MSTLPAAVFYRWTTHDHLTAQSPAYPKEGDHVDPAACVTPYLLLPQALLRPREIGVGEKVLVTLGRSYFPWSVKRFDIPDHEWRAIPAEVTGYTTIRQLFEKLHAHDGTKFDLFDPAGRPPTALAKLAHLVFEHWDNTDYRLAMTSSGSFDEKTLKRDVLDFPTEQGGQKLTHVPTREVLSPPAKAAPQPPSGGSPGTIVVPDPLFAVDLGLRRSGDDAFFTPIVEAEDKLRRSKIKLDVTIRKLKGRATAEETVVRVLLPDGATLFEESHTSGDLVTPGTHVWAWDGYSSGGVLDTAVLGPKGLTVEVRVTAKPGKDAVARAVIHGKHVFDWVDARVVEPSKRIALTLYLMPYKRSWDDLSDDDFRTAMQIVQEGIAKHWSRTITIDGQPYEVQASAVFTANRGVAYTIIGTTDPKARSCNLRLISSSFSVWYYYCKATDSRDLRETAAHEFGHSVLGAVIRGAAPFGPYGFHWSLTHKGSSNEVQGQNPNAPRYPDAPAECDVMIYYLNAEPEDAYDRCFGTSEDVKHLLAAAQVEIDE